MFGTIFDPEWIEGYRKDLKILLESDPSFDNNDCWFLLCALDDIAQGCVQNLQYDSATNVMTFQYVEPEDDDEDEATEA